MSDKREFRLNFFDRAINAVAPEWGLQRSLAKERIHRFGYDAANPGKERKASGGAAKNSNPENWLAQRETVEVMWTARMLEKASPFLVGILDRLAMYVCGTMTYRSQTGDKAIDSAYEDYFHDWCGRADLTKRFRFKHLVQQTFRGMVRDGDCGISLERRGVEWKLNVIEADRIGDPTSGIKPSDKLFRGLHIDDDGAPELFDIYKRTIDSRYKLEAQLPPERFIHFMDPMRCRPGQYRPVSMLAQALPKIQDLHEIFKNEILAHKNASAQAGFVIGGTAEAAWDKEETNADGQKLGVKKIVPGMITHLPEGQSIELAPGLQRPTGAFMALLQAEIREVATSLKLPYGFLYDLSALGGVTARIEVRSAERTIQYWQSLLVDLILDRVRDTVIGGAIARRELPAHARWKRGKWNFGPFLTADVGHETNADLALLAAGATTLTNIVEKGGGDVAEVAATRGREIGIYQEVAGDTAIPIELMVSNMPNATQLLAAMNTPPEDEAEKEPPPPPGMIGEVGDKGVGPLLKIIEGVSQGTIDRDGAVMSLMEIYGWDLQRAQMVVPVAPPAAPRIDTGGEA